MNFTWRALLGVFAGGAVLALANEFAGSSRLVPSDLTAQFIVLSAAAIVVGMMTERRYRISASKTVRDLSLWAVISVVVGLFAWLWH